MRIAIVTDAWAPQVNGVVRTLQAVTEELRRKGHQIGVVSPDQFRSLPCPTYPEIRLALTGTRTVGKALEAFGPDCIHLATEGPLGVAARRWCLGKGHRFTTAYHTQFPDYLAARTGLPKDFFWRYINWFHGPAKAILVSTETMAAQLKGRDLGQTRRWGRGVDLRNFRPDIPRHSTLSRLPGPVQLYVGRVAVEKNIEAFLRSAHPGSKVVVGDGPALPGLRRKYPEVSFLGTLHGETLASAYATADIFVFPSHTDTFGMVMIEALACGTPVAAFPVPGPLDVLTAEVGSMRGDLDDAIAEALTRDRHACAAYGARFSWQNSAAEFESALAPL